MRGIALLLLIASTGVFAHAVVVESTPKDRAALTAAPREIELRFNVRIEQALARASLRKGKAAPVSLTPRKSTSPQSDRLTVPMPPLGAGSYELHYHVLAADGHATQGILRFSIAP